MNPSSYGQLPERFFARVTPTPVARPRLIKFNRILAHQLGEPSAEFNATQLANLYSGNALPSGTAPIAMAYAGHQFGHFVPQLGDGRAILLGEAKDSAGMRRDVQLKGSGRTPYSRNGDGRSALGPVLREYLVSEAMHALGIPATRALAVVSTGETVQRDGPVPGAILTRVAASHVRVGTFEFFAARADTDAIRQLADYVIERHYSQLLLSENRYVGLLTEVSTRQAALIADWMQVGFIHGVMNTDNMAVSGETIDFGPCAFMDSFDPSTVFSSIDARGRYAYGNQPHAAAWNLARFAETLLPLIHADATRAVEMAGEVIATFAARFNSQWHERLRRKLGLSTERAGDQALAEDLLAAMHRQQADFTLTFRGLCDAVEDPPGDGALREMFSDSVEFGEWMARWRARLQQEPLSPEARATAMRLVNPAYIPRNHRIEQAINAAVEQDDFQPFEALSAVLARPYQSKLAYAAYANPPRADERVLQTFCGT